MITTQQFIKQNGIKATVQRVDNRPDDLGNWGKGSRHFLYTLTREGSAVKLTGFYSQGSAHTKGPTTADIFDALRCDASCAEQCEDLAEFLIEFGYCGDPDSVRRGQKAFEACRETAGKLNAMLGDLDLSDVECL